MPPVTQKPPISAEGIKAKNSIAEVRQQVNLGATPQEARATLGDIKKGYIPSQLPTQPLVATRLNPTIPNVIPSTALAGNKTFEDVMDTRANLETQATAKQQLTDRIKGTTDRIGATTSSTFENPDAIINRLALNRVPTETEAQRAAKQAGAVQNRRDYAGDIATARQDLGTQYGLPDLTARKAEVTTQYTEREQKMNDDIKRLEENASKRGVARQYVEAEKQKIKSDALEDLSNYAAIEAALSGSITEARSIINDSINDKKSAFELENQSIQQEINYLSTLVGEDNQREATQLQIALDERKRLQDAQLAKETAIRNYAADVAAEGADDGTINAILKSGTEEEALRYAAPYLGRLDREVKQSQLYTSSLQQQKLIAELNPTDTGNSGDLVAYGQQFAESGKLPSVSELKQSGLTVSQVTEYAKQAPKPEGTILSTNTGIKSTSISPTQEDGILALYDIQKKVADLKALDEKRQQGLLSAGVGKIFGLEDQQRYIDLRGEIVDLLARARTGAALTTQEEEFYASQLPGRIGQVGVIPGTNKGLFGVNSQNRIDNFGTKIQGTLDTKLSGTGTVIQGYSKVNIPSLGEKTVGEVIDIGGTQYRVLADGTLTDII